MDKLTKKLIDKANAYNNAAQELRQNGAKEDKLEFVEFQDGFFKKAVRAFCSAFGFSSKYPF